MEEKAASQRQYCRTVQIRPTSHAVTIEEVCVAVTVEAHEQPPMEAAVPVSPTASVSSSSQKRCRSLVPQ